MVSENQLSLFDIGLDAISAEATPIRALVRATEPKFLRSPNTQPIASNTFKLNLRSTSDPAQPTLFEKAAYDIYLKSKAEMHASGCYTGVLMLILLAIVFCDVKASEAGVGLIKFGSLKPDIIIGIIGWFTVAFAVNTIIKEEYLRQNKNESGLFYRRLINYSESRTAWAVFPFFDIIYVGIFLGLIALTLIVARFEMVSVIRFYLGVPSFFDPWHPVLRSSSTAWL